VTAVSPVVCHTIHTFETVDSTQAVLGRLAANGAPEGTVVAARHQTAGRGSRGKQWWDAPGESLMFSALLRPGVPIARAPQLSLVSGVGVVDALHTCCDVDARIRWPNDVLIEGKKVCGVLPEAVSHADGRVNYVLLGIGINVHQREFPLELRDTATSLLLATGVMHDRAQLLSAMLTALDRRYGEWLSSGFAELRVEWRKRAAMLGQRVRMRDGSEGLAVDVDDTGALLVDTGRGALTRVVSAVADPGEKSA
jgi:BirA family transcriptional regulator, biotin operon repressor / biotin---[acetyl-CoA-carboxylase] ligase